MHNDLNKFEIKIFKPFEPIVIEFINLFSIEIRKHKKFKNFPDLHFLSLWTSKTEIKKKKEVVLSNENRFGRGLVLHITPSNLPTNFAYSFLIGLISGNSNIVKLPSKEFEETKIILSVIKNIFKLKKFSKLKRSNFFVKFNRDSEILRDISKICDARVIWGGDKTIQAIRKLGTPERCIDLNFSDRYSFSVINSKEYLKLSKNKKLNLSKKFFYDAYLSDQMACNSPHCLVWIGNKKNEDKIFWSDLINIVKKKYFFDNKKTIDKYNHLFETILNKKYISKILLNNNNVRVLELKNNIKNIEEFRGIYGTFYQLDFKNFSSLKNIINKKCQTIASFGFNKKDYIDLIASNNIRGLDRVVPFGQSMNFTMNWDSYNLVTSLSRVLEINDKV